MVKDRKSRRSPDRGRGRARHLGEAPHIAADTRNATRDTIGRRRDARQVRRRGQWCARESAFPPRKSRGTECCLPLLGWVRTPQLWIAGGQTVIGARKMFPRTSPSSKPRLGADSTRLAGEGHRPVAPCGGPRTLICPAPGATRRLALARHTPVGRSSARAPSRLRFRARKNRSLTPRSSAEGVAASHGVFVRGHREKGREALRWRVSLDRSARSSRGEYPLL